MKRLSLSEKEAVALALLTMTGATAFDTPGSVAKRLRAAIEKKFGIEIDGETLASVVTKVRNLVTESGHEEVFVDTE